MNSDAAMVLMFLIIVCLVSLYFVATNEVAIYDVGN